jgi:hypothetical protein
VSSWRVRRFPLRSLEFQPVGGTHTRGHLVAVVTPGGHRRFPVAVVLAFLREMGFDDQAAAKAVRGVK